MIQVSLYKIKYKVLKAFLALSVVMFLGLTTFAQEPTTYDEAVIYGDRLYKKSELLNAKGYYQLALKIKPGDDYAKNKIITIVEKMKSAMAAEDEYYDLVDIADELYDKNELEDAIIKYKKALEIIPDDEYALTKVREIIAFQTDEKDKIDAYNKAMEAGKTYVLDKQFDNAIASFSEAASIFPNKEAALKELSNVNNLKFDYEQREIIFNDKLDEASKYLLIKNYVEALRIYGEADEILPESDIAKKKISEISPLAKIQKKYNIQVEKADEFYISKDFISSRKQYLVAANLWPDKNYPNDMIAKIDDKLAEGRKDIENNYKLYVNLGDSLLEIKEYSQALSEFNLALNLKPNEEYPKAKLLEIGSFFEKQKKAFEANYSKMITSADSAFNVGLYNIAEGKYNTAIEVKPEDEYPQSQLVLIESIKKVNADKDKLDSDYNELIGQADKLYASGNYELAIKKYKEAQAIKSIESYPQSKIDAIKIYLADAQKQRQIDDKYKELIIIAVRLFNEDKLSDARSSYANAVDLKPDESLPQQEILKIDSLIVLRANLEKTKEQYDALIADGDLYKQKEEYGLAILKYDEALAIMPKDEIARKKKLDVKTIQINIQKEIDRTKSYEDAIAKGDNLFNDGSFELAQVEFEKARSLKNNEEYPNKRIQDITVALEKLEAEKEQRYTTSIVSADNFFEQGNYEDAVIKYKVALSIKPSEKNPQQKIAECNGFIAEHLKLLSAEYDVAIANADKLYASKIYDKAIVAFRKAENIKADETYPAEMINKISKYIEENSIVDVIINSKIISMGATEKFLFEPVKISVRKSNYIFLKAKNLSGKSIKIIFSYGSDTGKNGGFVVQISEGEDFNDYIVRVGNQYKWFAEDNNWITIHPENGEVEITMLRISKGY
jgi:tetratricopeptide (TPR) repeat protein